MRQWLRTLDALAGPSIGPVTAEDVIAGSMRALVVLVGAWFVGAAIRSASSRRLRVDPACDEVSVLGPRPWRAHRGHRPDRPGRGVRHLTASWWRRLVLSTVGIGLLSPIADVAAAATANVTDPIPAGDQPLMHPLGSLPTRVEPVDELTPELGAIDDIPLLVPMTDAPSPTSALPPTTPTDSEGGRGPQPGTAREPSRTPTTAPPNGAETGPQTDTGAGAAASTSWTVRRGDNLWQICAEVLTERLGQRPTEQQILDLLHTTVDHNRLRLTDPSRPDLIHPGQVFDIP